MTGVMEHGDDKGVEHCDDKVIDYCEDMCHGAL